MTGVLAVDYLLMTLAVLLLAPMVAAFFKWLFFPSPDSRRGVWRAFRRELNALVKVLRHFDAAVLNPHRHHLRTAATEEERIQTMTKLGKVEHYLETMWKERQAYWLARFKEVNIPVKPTYFDDIGMKK